MEKPTTDFDSLLLSSSSIYLIIGYFITYFEFLYLILPTLSSSPFFFGSLSININNIYIIYNTIIHSGSFSMSFFAVLGTKHGHGVSCFYTHFPFCLADTLYLFLDFSDFLFTHTHIEKRRFSLLFRCGF